MDSLKDGDGAYAGAAVSQRIECLCGMVADGANDPDTGHEHPFRHPLILLVLLNKFRHGIDRIKHLAAVFGVFDFDAVILFQEDNQL